VPTNSSCRVVESVGCRNFSIADVGEADNPTNEWNRLELAISAASREIAAIHQVAISRLGVEQAAIFEAHQLLLRDPDVQERLRQRIFTGNMRAESAWSQIIEETADSFDSMEDSYLRERSSDVRDVGERVLIQLSGHKTSPLVLAKPSIVVAQDLTPSDALQLEPEKVLGIVVGSGSKTSHSAILARALGIPLIVGVGNSIDQLPEGRQIAIDGRSGQIWPEVGTELLAELRGRRDAWLERRTRDKALGQALSITIDGRSLEIGANITGQSDAAVAFEYGAEGIGLFRTEFLYLGRQEPPGEDEQYATYRAVAEIAGSRPVTIRTLDVGGDKPLPYLDPVTEENPFLGWRGIRFCLDRPELFRTQLRAILRAGHGHNLQLMLPMISSVEEVVRSEHLIAEVAADLDREGIAHDDQMDIGLMIEVPAAVMLAPELAARVSFFSIGTNDLAQYCLAADRGNARVAGLADPLQPAVLRMIEMTVDAAHLAGIPVSICGELAGDPLATPVLLGLGLDKLSMTANSIAAVKQVVRRMTHRQSKSIAAAALKLQTAAEVRDYLAQAVAS